MKNLIALILFAAPILLSGQSTVKSKYWIQFTDRAGTPFSVSNPDQYLSQRAIDRRIKQNIVIRENDLPVNRSYIDSVLSKGPVTLLNRSKWFNAITVYTTDTNALIAINALPFVVKIKPVESWKWPKETEEISEAAIRKSGAIDGKMNSVSGYDYGAGFNQVNMLGVDCMHDKGFRGEGMVIAILDAGFYQADITVAFDSLRANNQILGTWDFVFNESSVYEDDLHGEMVLSCMGSNLPGQMIGTAPKASFWLLKTEDTQNNKENIVEEDNWVAGAEFADSVGADVINSSLGYKNFDDPAQDHPYSDLDGNTARVTIGADIAASKGILVVNSAGNSGAGKLNAPADGDSVLAVGAVDAAGAYATFSSEGPSADGDVKPNIAAQGAQATVYYPWGVGTSNGTSFSSPIMAGAAAVLWQSMPNSTNMQIFNAIQKSGNQFANPDIYLGYGIPNMCIANQILLGVDPVKFTKTGIVDFYSNPFTTSIDFTFYTDSADNLKIDLSDIQGRHILTTYATIQPRSLTKISLQEGARLSSGLYLLNITSKSNNYLKKVCKY